MDCVLRFSEPSMTTEQATRQVSNIHIYVYFFDEFGLYEIFEEPILIFLDSNGSRVALFLPHFSQRKRRRPQFRLAAFSQIHDVPTALHTVSVGLRD